MKWNACMQRVFVFDWCNVLAESFYRNTKLIDLITVVNSNIRVTTPQYESVVNHLLNWMAHLRYFPNPLYCIIHFEARNVYYASSHAHSCNQLYHFRQPPGTTYQTSNTKEKLLTFFNCFDFFLPSVLISWSFILSRHWNTLDSLPSPCTAWFGENDTSESLYIIIQRGWNAQSHYWEGTIIPHSYSSARYFSISQILVYIHIMFDIYFPSFNYQM